nr:MAG TPA: hypothetical protein [Inoviridae sp.]
MPMKRSQFNCYLGAPLNILSAIYQVAKQHSGR